MMMRARHLRKIAPQDGLEDIFHDFLSGDRMTGIYNFMYQDDLHNASAPCNTGGESWDNVLDPNNAYYIFANEAALIARAAPEIAKIIPYNSTLVELGTGSNKAVVHKTIPLLQALKPQRFIANDLSQKSVNSARIEVRNRLPFLQVETCASDFLQEDSDILSYAGSNVLLTGSTVSNVMSYDGHIPAAAVVDYLRKVARILGKNGHLMITQDTNQDAASLIASYEAPAIAQFLKDALYRMQTWPGLEALDPDALRYEAIWDEKSHLLANTFLNMKDQTVVLRGKALHIPKGRRLYVVNSYKYPKADFLHMARIAGLAPVRTWMDAQERVALHVLKKI